MNLSTPANMGAFPMDYGFEIEEACELLNLTVVALDNTHTPPRISEIGIICGVLTCNEEVEIVIKFLDQLRQYTKAEFIAQLKILKE